MNNSQKITVIACVAGFLLLTIAIVVGVSIWMGKSSSTVIVAPAESAEPTAAPRVVPRPLTPPPYPGAVNAAVADHIAPAGTSKLDVSPFSGARLNGDLMEVEVDGKWYQLIAINQVAAGDIITFCKATYKDRWSKRAIEDLVQVLIAMGHGPGSTADLQLRSLDSGQDVTLGGVAITEANRQSIMETQLGAANPAGVGRRGNKAMIAAGA